MNQKELGALTMALGKAGLAAGTTTTITIANTIDYAIKGKAYQKSAVSDTATPTTDRITGSAFNALAASQGCIFAICLDSDGTVRVSQGKIKDLDSNDRFVTAPDFPPIKESDCLIGYIVAKNQSTGSSWTFGSSNWTATGMDDDFNDAITVPDREQVS